MMKNKVLCSLLTLSILTTSACGGSDGGKTKPIIPPEPTKQEEVDRITINMDLNNSFKVYDIGSLMGAIDNLEFYEIVDEDGVALELDNVKIHKNSNIMIIKSPIEEKLSEIKFSIQKEDKRVLDDETGEHEIKISHFIVKYNNEEGSRLSGQYNYALVDGTVKIDLDLSGYKVFDFASKIETQSTIDSNINGDFFNACNNIKETGVFKESEVNNHEQMNRFTCDFYKDVELDNNDANFNVTNNFIDKNIMIQISRKQTPREVLYFDSLNKEMLGVGNYSGYYVIDKSNKIFEKETVDDQIETSDNTLFLTPGESRKLKIVLGNFGLIIRNNDIFLYNALSDKVIPVSMNIEEESSIQYLPTRDTQTSFKILEEKNNGDHKVWSIGKDLLGKVEVESLGQIADVDGVKSIVKTESNYYTISEIRTGEFALKSNGEEVSPKIIFENNNGIIHDRYQDEVVVPVVLSGKEYIYKYNGSIFEEYVYKYDVNGVEVEGSIDMMSKKNSIKDGRVFPPLDYDKQMSFKNMNYMNEIYVYKNGILTSMVLHEYDNNNHQELFYMPSHGGETILHNLKKYIADGQPASGMATLVYKINKVVNFNGNIFILMNKNGVNVMQHQNGSHIYDEVEDVEIYQGEKDNLVGVKGSKILHLCDIDGNITEATNTHSKMSDEHIHDSVSEGYKDLSLIGEELIYLSNGLIERIDISESNCK